MRGGYQIVNLKGISLSNTAVVIPGIYESIEGNHFKPLLLSGINLSGVEKADSYITTKAGTNDFTISVYEGTITVTNEDFVTFLAN